MALKHILRNRTYSARALWQISEGQPFGWSLDKWRKELFGQDSGLFFVKNPKAPNSSIRVLGGDYLDFVGKQDNLRKFRFNK